MLLPLLLYCEAAFPFPPGRARATQAAVRRAPRREPLASAARSLCSRARTAENLPINFAGFRLGMGLTTERPLDYHGGQYCASLAAKDVMC